MSFGTNLFDQRNFVKEQVTAQQVALQVRRSNPDLYNADPDRVNNAAHSVMSNPEMRTKSLSEIAAMVVTALQSSQEEQTNSGKRPKRFFTEEQKKQLKEERTLNDNAASMIERATGICMEIWYNLTHAFHSHADKFDPEAVNPSEKFQYFKLAPGGDARHDAYKKIIKATEDLADKLNDSLGRGGLFVPEIILKDGHLETRVTYTEGDGGIFHAKSKDQDVGIGITITMPRQGVIRDAFKSLVTTPKFPIGNDENIPEPKRVVPDPPQNPDDDVMQPAADGEGRKQQTSLADLGGVNIAGPGNMRDLPDQSPLNQSYETDGEELKEQQSLFNPSQLERGDWFIWYDEITKRSKEGITISNDTKRQIIKAVVPFYSRFMSMGDIDLEDPGASLNIEYSAILRRTEPREMVENVNEGKRPAEGFSAPSNRGYYVVYGNQKFQGDAEFYWKGRFKNFGTSLPGKPFESKEDAVAAKDQILQGLRQNGKRFSAAGKFHVKYWDGQEYNAVNIPQALGYQNIGTPDQEEEPQEQQPQMSDDTPLSSDVSTEEQPTEEPQQQSSGKYCPHCGNQIRESIEHVCEEVAANAVSTGAMNSGKGSPDPHSDTRDSKGKKKKKDDNEKIVRRKKNEENWSLSGGLFT